MGWWWWWRSGCGGLDVGVWSWRFVLQQATSPVLQLLGGLGACCGSVGTPGRVWKGHTGCEVCVWSPCWGRCLLQQLHLRSCFPRFCFFFFPMLGCNGVVGPGGIGTNFCTCCSENAGNGSRDRNGLTFTSSPCVRDLTLPNLLCWLYFSWVLGRLDTYLFFDACTIRLLVLS